MPAALELERFGDAIGEELVTELRNVGLEISTIAEEAMLETTELMELVTKLAIKEKDLLFRRLLLNSIARTVDFEGSPADFVITGAVWSDEPYAEVMDLGRRPGRRMPPIKALIPWVQYRLRVADEMVRSVAFLVARSIARKGIKGRHYFKRAEEVAKRNWPKILDRRVRAWLERGRT